MKVNRELLEKKLNILINEHGEDRKVVQEILQYYKNKNISSRAINEMLKLRIHLGTVRDLDLGLFTQAMYQATKNESINPTVFFTDLEIKNISDYAIEKEETNIYPIVFENVSSLNEDQWVTYLTAQRVAELYNNHAITYNPESQRAFKTKENYYGKIVEQIDINAKSVKAIEKEILDNKFITNFITFNILQNGQDNIEYDLKNDRLIIHDGEIDILDGFHRSMGILNAVNTNKDINFRIGVILTNFDIQKARRFIVQEDKKNPINKEHIKNIDVDNMANKVVNRLNQDGNFLLGGEITTDKKLITANKKKINGRILADTIQGTFKPESSKDLVKHTNLIKDRLNYIIEQKLELLDECVEDQYIWMFYVILIYMSTKKDNWQEYINNNLNKYELLDNIKKVNKNTIKQVKSAIEG